MLGGEAANTASALRAWDRNVLLAGNGFGTGPESEILWDLIEAKGLPTNLLESRDHSRAVDSGPDQSLAPVCDIYVTPDGERTMFGQGFAHATPSLNPESLPFQAGEWFTAEPNMVDTARRTLKLAHKKAMKVYVMDFIREDDFIPPGGFWQSSTDWAGHRNNMQKNLQWVKNWVAKHGCFAILSDGPNGFVFGGPETPVRAYPPFPAPSVIDTTGAGDLFRAGMLYGLDQGLALADCLRFAAAAGCLKCQYLGATTRVPTVEEIYRHIAENSDVAAHYG